MAGRTGRANSDKSVHEADTSSIISGTQDLDDVSVERKDQYLNRIKKENKSNAKTFKKSDEHLVIEGSKVLRKMRNATGSEYTFYWFNLKKHKEHARTLREVGKLEYGDSELGTARILTLKTIDGKAFKPKGK